MSSHPISDAVVGDLARPMTAAQRGIHYAQQLEPDVPMSVAAYAEFHAPVDATVLDAAVRAAGLETESGLLRLVPVDDGEPLALVDRERSIDLGERDFSDEPDPRAAALAWIDEHRSRVVDLYADPLLETHLLHLSPTHSIWYCWGHHIAFDGYAAMYMMLRVAQHYTALAAGTAAPDIATATLEQIADFDDDYRASSTFSDDREFWHEHLLGGTEPDAASLSPRSAAAAPVATVRTADLDDALVDAIRIVADAHHVRPASVITAAVAAYLARFNDRDDAMLSLPVAVRDREILRTSAGLTSNVLPILTHLGTPAAPRTVGELLTAMNTEIKHAVRHQRFRHEEISAEILGSTGGRGFFGPMVNVMLFFEQIDFGSLRGDLHVLSTGPVEDLSVNVYDSFTGGMRLDVEANPNVYSHTEVDAHHRRIIDFLTAFLDVDNPDNQSAAATTAIPLMADVEAIEVNSAATGEHIPDDGATLTALLAAAYDSHRDATALIGADGTELTYGALRARTDAISTGLRNRGVGNESVVAVMIPRSIEQVLALHAVIAAGAAFLPIAPDEPADRRDHILSTACPDLVITSAEHPIDDMDITTATLSQLDDEGAQHVLTPVTADPAGLAYVLFTSGSTGRPKGVEITHRSVVNRLRWMQSRYRIDQHDRVLQKTPASFDVSVWEFFWPLITGATLVVPGPDTHRDPWQLRDTIAAQRITTLHFVPSMLAAFASAMSDDTTIPGDAGTTGDTGTARADLRSIRQIFTSGEALTPSTVGAISAITDAPVHNLYGPTEAAIDVTFHDNCRADSTTIPIGMPVWNTTAHVLDRALRVQPVGAIGELYLGGIQVARAYRARPDLTASRFVAAPDGSGTRLYRTGDLVRRTADGSLEYLGRSDSQVKIRGQRVELGEIEAALADLSGVRSAAVVLRGSAESATLAGYVVGTGLDPAGIRTALVDRLPAHMIPTTIDVLDDFPTTSNGKLDRRALPDPVIVDDDRLIAPTDAVDALVADTVGAVLGVASVSMGAHFFDLGGNSLSATRVAARLAKATHRRVGIRTIFDADTIADISSSMRALGVTAAECAIASDGPTEASRDEPADAGRVATGRGMLSAAQQRLWLTYRMDPESAATYNIPFTVRLVGPLDIDALTLALNDVIGRHEPLRTTVVEREGQAYAQIHEPAADLIDLPVGTATELDDARTFAARPFDLTTDLPMRAQLIRTSDDDHQLAIVIHHIAADGWSLAPLAADLATAYRARRDSRVPAWIPLARSYSQVSDDHRRLLADVGRDDLDFWTRTLAGAPAETELPTDRPRPRTPDVRGATRHIHIGRRRHEQLRRLSDEFGVTMFMVVHAAVAALLRSMSRTDDIVIGTPVSGRGDADLDPLVGMFVNTVALRTAVDKAASFGDLVARVRDLDISAFDHADLPFDQLVTELNPHRSPAIHPIFQVSLAVEDTSAISLEFADLTATAARIDTGHTKFDLEFTFTEHTGTDGEATGLALEIGYATALFDDSTIDALGGRLVRMIDAATADPDLPIGDIGTLDPHERLDLVPAVGAGRRPGEHLTSLLAAAAESDPDHIALSCGERTLSYERLDAWSNRLARHLIDAGAGPEQFVAVSLPRGLGWMVTLWAVAKTGAAWVPVDPEYPAQRKAFMLSDSAASLLVTDNASMRPGQDVDGVTVVSIDDTKVTDEVTARSDAPVDDTHRRAPIEVDQPAYLIYTSGTTGTPKGVVVSHRGLADFAAAQVSHFNVTASSRTLHLASPSFDASVLEVLMAISAGARMHIVAPGIVGGRELADEMRGARVTHAFLTPSLLTTMSPDDLPDLHTVVIGGEHPNPEAVRRWSDGRALFNAYGPTETTVVATMSEDIDPGDTVTIGRPIHGISAMVLDERLRPVAPGAVGELYISGPHLARGYHGIRPLTSKRFVANPFGDMGERMYRTGDLVRWTAEHTLEFRGRADDQTKVRGHRIELGEIDAALLADERVRAAVTTTHGDGDAARLTSYITLSVATDSDARELVRSIRDRLADRLPRHMIPSAIITLDEIPTTPIGKVDLRALPAPTTTPEQAAEPAVTDTERLIAGTIADVLDRPVDEVGRTGDFFDLGGNSLSATQVMAQLEDVYAQRIPVRTLFDHPTAADLAAHLGDPTRPGDADTHAHDDSEVRHDPDAPAAPGAAQQQLWFLNQMARDDDADDTRAAAGAYNIAFALTLTGDLDVDALGGALHHVVDRHEPLRTVYPDHDGIADMHILDAAQACPELNVTTVTSDEWSTQATQFAATGFDLTADPPIRAALHHITDHGEDDKTAEHRLTIVIHHIAADGFSMAPLARDLADAYTDLVAGSAPRQAPLSLTYRDHMARQREVIADRGAVDWWVAELADVDFSPVLVEDGPDMPGRSGAASVTRALDPNLRAALVDSVRRDARDTTEFMTMHAVFAAALHRFHADPDIHVAGTPSTIMIGTPVAGRPDPRLADVVGMFVNSVALRTHVDGSAPFTDLVQTVRNRDLDAFSHAEVPFEQVVAAINPPRTGRHPLFSIALTLDDFTGDDIAASLQLGDLAVDTREVGTAATRFDLELRIRGEELTFTYDAALFGDRQITMLADAFLAVAQQVAIDPSTRPDDIALPGIELPGVGLSGTDTVASTGSTVPPRHLADILAGAVRDHADRTAIVDGATSSTYQELDRRSDRWAARLADLGVGPQQTVVVALGRSAESVTAVWAVTKVGAAVVPVDPGYPTERIAHMIADSGAVAGISTTELVTSLPPDIDWLTTAALDDVAVGDATMGDATVGDATVGDATVRTAPTGAHRRRVDTTAYVIYTSGSTGTPKGVEVTHRGLAAFADAQQRAYGVDSDSRTLHFASPSFDAAMLEFLLAAYSGATMVVAPPTIYGGDELIDFLAENEVTHAFITPSALAAATPRALPRLRTIGVGGEASPPELVARWSPGRRYINCYGPTETTIVATMSEPLTPGRPVTIGRPIDQCGALILDHALRPVADHVPGELYLTGPGLARGYTGHPDRTAGRFVAAPGGDGGLMYRTGDIVHRRDDGSLIYHSRTDNQVKVRGFRIELDEVNRILTEHPAVSVAITIVHGSGSAATLAAYVVGAPVHLSADLPTALTDHARSHLPRQMVPSSITVLDEIPLTPNGKLDTALLPEPVITAAVAGRQPGDPAEAFVAQTLSDVLGIEDVSADDDFFALGGTSLQATTLTSRLNRGHRGTPIRVRTVFDHPTVAQLAGFLGELTDDTASGASAPDVRHGDAPVPLAPVQRRIWSLARTAPESTDYLIPFTIRWRGALDVAALRSALGDIVSWHTSLRTVYPIRDGEVVGVTIDDVDAVVGPLEPVTGEHVDVASAYREMSAGGWDVTSDAPFSAGLLRTADDDHTLILVIHHIAADGASLPVLVGDLLNAYRQRAEGRSAGWLRDGADYGDYAVEAARGESDVAHWVSLLDGAPAECTIPPTLSTGHSPTGTTSGRSLTIPVDESLRRAINEFAHRTGGTVFTVVHTAIAILLNRLGVGDDVVIGTPVANRAPAGATQDYEQVVGMFVNTLALRTGIDPTTTVEELLNATRTADLDALDHADVPFDDVVSALNPQRELGRHPLFQIALSVHEFATGLAGEHPVVEGLSAQMSEINTAAAKFDLQFTVTGMGVPASEASDGTSGATFDLTYDSARYDERTARELVVRLKRVLRAMICDPLRCVGDVRIIDPLEIAALSPVFGPVAPARRTFGDLLADAAHRNPDGVAAVSDTASITYRELDERSNRLARLLLGRGVGGDRAESIVAMAIPRSIDAVTAVWAIVKTGAAYVPVDPTYPPGRIAHMLGDSGAELIVTTASSLPAVEIAGTQVPSIVLDETSTQRRMAHSSSATIDDAERHAPIRVDQLAYMIYTSGSTGRPKGVLVPHRGLAAVSTELRRRMRPEPGSRVLHFASPSFDASVLEFLLAAAGASTLVIAPTDVYGGRPLAEVIARHEVTHAFITPAAVASMNPADVPSLTGLAVGGEAYGSDLVRRWAPGRSLFNVYGPTETTVITTSSDRLDADTDLTIGRPNNGVAAVILDARLHPAPMGVTGELYLIGDQVTRGYHERRELTATRFVPAPMCLGSHYRGQRMYRTGDLAAWTSDRRLRYVGRADDQVQIRGFRVELGEIDDALATHPDVDFAVTVVDDGPHDARVLRSYVTAAGESAPDTTTLRGHVSDRLPRHMIPSTITVLDEIPMTPVGKLDRAALPTPEVVGFRPPAAGWEATIAGVFAEVLSIEQVGADDGFFDLGGNSLMATTVSATLSDALGLDVSAQQLFTAPSPAELAAALRGDGSDRNGDVAAGHRAGLQPVLPLRRPRADDKPSPTPLFVVHPAIGLSWGYTSLLPHIPGDQAVYGLQNPVLSSGPDSGNGSATDAVGSTSGVPTIATVAADYVDRIRQIAPDGPYRLVGWSLGGLIAQEMAVLLTESGDHVEQLVLLDSFVIADRPGFDEPPSIAELMREFGIELPEISGSDGEPTLDEAWQAIRHAGGPLAELGRDDLALVHQAFRSATPLAADWRPRIFHGDMTIVSATADPPPGPPAAADWRSRVDGRLTEVTTDCTHARMLLPENVITYVDHIVGHPVDVIGAPAPSHGPRDRRLRHRSSAPHIQLHRSHREDE